MVVEEKNGNESNSIDILFLGDVVGKGGRRALKDKLPGLIDRLNPDCVIVNGENSAGGIGITPSTAKEIFAAGADIITSGNHVWKKREIYSYLDQNHQLLRPLNYPPGAPGRGVAHFTTARGFHIGIINLQGRVFMEAVDCPFRAADNALQELCLGREVDVVIVDFHAEATSEKMGMGHHLDGRVTAVLGTHTHIPTADHRVLKGGSGFMSDVGMCGPYDSMIGMETSSVMGRFLTQMPSRFQPSNEAVTISGVIVKADPKSGLCLQIIPLRQGGDLTQT